MESSEVQSGITHRHEAKHMAGDDLALQESYLTYAENQVSTISVGPDILVDSPATVIHETQDINIQLQEDEEGDDGSDEATVPSSKEECELAAEEDKKRHDERGEPPNEPKKRRGCFIPGSGIYRDVRRRLPWYLSDLIDGIHPKVIASIVFMFFTSIAPALSFGSLLSTKTNFELGVTEVLFATAVCGMGFAITAGQPMVIVGVTGPVVIFSTTVYDLSKRFNIPFVPWLCIIGFESAFMHILLAVFNATTLVKHVTRFTTEIFSALIAIIYVVSAFEQLVAFFQGESIEGALFSLLIAFGSFYLAYCFHYARSWIYFPRIVCKTMADLAVPISIGIFTGIAYLPKLNKIGTPFLEIPTKFTPTDPARTGQWVIRYDGLPIWAFFAALIPALILTALFFFDHNVSSLLSQKKEFKLKKGTAYHWDFLIIGVNIAVCSIIGIPVTNGLIPQAPLHIASVTRIQQIEEKDGKLREEIVGVRENRIGGFVHALLIGVVAMVGQKALKLIPQGVMTGLFLFMGVTGFDGNQFIDRIKLWFTHPMFYKDIRHEFIRKIPLFHTAVYTLIQFMCWAIIYAITWTPAAIIFPLLILMLIPVRKVVMVLLFTREQLFYLDNELGEVPDFIPPERTQTKRLKLPRQDVCLSHSKIHTNTQRDSVHQIESCGTGSVFTMY